MLTIKSRYENLRLPAVCVIFVLLTIKLFIMRNYSIPPYDLAEIGQEVKRIGERLGIPCNLAHTTKFKELGFYSLPTLSEDIVRIAASYGVEMPVTGDLAQTGIQLQALLVALRERGVLLD